MKEFLKKSASALSIELTDEMLEKFQIYFDFLLETNKSLNLTAITEMKDVVLKHFVDSISIVSYFDLKGKKVIDVGTGAGFPGIPLAILNPDTEFVLADSLKKRLHFIDQVTEKCDLKNVTTVHGRAEDLGQDTMYRERFDYCVSRAVASLPVLLELCIPFVKQNGYFISYKSETLQQELGQAKHAMQKLNRSLYQEYSYTLPETDYYRVLAAFSKNGPLKKKYPRQAGKPKRNPL